MAPERGLPDGPVLYLDTTQPVLHLGLSAPGKGDDSLKQCHRMIARHQQACDSHRYHSAVMTPAIDQMLKQAGLTPRDLAGIAVNPGPGSFTGVRTGIITARTLAQFLPIPVYTPSTFDLLAWKMSECLKHGQPIAIYINALRGRAYHAVLLCAKDGLTLLKKPCFITLAGSEKPGQPLEVIEQDLELPESAFVFASAELHPFLRTMPVFQGQAEKLHDLPEGKDWDVPEVMMALLSAHGQGYQTPWREVLPLYIQEPSVTVKKSIIHGS